MATASEIDIQLRARDQMTATLRKASAELGGFGKAAQNVGQLAAGFGLAQIALQAASRGFEMVAGAIVGFNSKMEQASKAFTTLLGSGEKARQFLGELEKFAAETPFEFPELVQASQRLLAMGFSAQQVVPLLTDVGNAVASLGGGSAEINRVTLALGQMQAKTKVSAEEMNQLTEVGIPGWRILSEAIGKSVGETMKLAEQGKISSAVFIQAFQQFSRANFGGAMADQAKTFEGAMSTVRDNLTSAVATGFKPFFEVLSQGAQRMAEFTKSRDFQAWAQSVALHAQFAIDAVGVLAPAFQRAFENIARIVITIGTIILNAFSLLSPFTRHSPSLVDEVQRGFGVVIPQVIQGMVPRIVPALQAASAAVQGFAGVVSGALTMASEQARAALERTIGFLGSGAVTAFREAEAAIRELEEAERDLATALTEAEDRLKDQEALLKPLQAIADAAQKRFEGLKDAISKAQQALADFARVPLAGEKEARDKIFSLDQQIKAKRLELLELVRKPGESEKDFQKRKKALEEEIAMLEKAREIERLRAEIKFDPQRKELEDIANREKEISFETARANAVAMVEKLAQLEASLPAFQAAAESSAGLVEAQKAAIEAQKMNVDLLKTAHEGVTKEITTQKARMSEIVQVAKDLEAAAKAAAAALKGGGAGISLPGLPEPPGTRRPEDDDRGPREANGLSALAADLQKKLAALKQAAADFNAPLQKVADTFAAAAGTGKTLAEALEALQKAWDTNAKPAITALWTMIDREVMRATNAWITVINNDLIPALGTIKTWWDGPGGKQTLSSFGTFMSIDLAKTALGIFQLSIATNLIAPLTGFVMWWNSPDGKGTFTAIETWFKVTAPAALVTFLTSLINANTNLGTLRTTTETFINTAGAAFLDWAKSTLWDTPRAKLQELIDLIGGTLTTVIDVAIKGPFDALLTIINKIAEAIRKAIDAWKDLQSRITGGGAAIPSGPGFGGGGGERGINGLGASVVVNVDNRGRDGGYMSVAAGARDGTLAALRRARLVSGAVGG